MATTLTIEEVKRFNGDHMAAIRDLLRRDGIAALDTATDAEARKCFALGFTEVLRLKDGAMTYAVDDINPARPLKWSESQIAIDVPEVDDALRLPVEFEALLAAARAYDPAAVDELTDILKDANKLRPIYWAIFDRSPDFRGDDLIETCRDWRIQFESPDESQRWIEAGFWAPEIARQLRDLGFSPDAARNHARAISLADKYRERFGRRFCPIHELCARDLSVDEFCQGSQHST